MIIDWFVVVERSVVNHELKTSHSITNSGSNVHFTWSKIVGQCGFKVFLPLDRHCIESLHFIFTMVSSGISFHDLNTIIIPATLDVCSTSCTGHKTWTLFVHSSPFIQRIKNIQNFRQNLIVFRWNLKRYYR